MTLHAGNDLADRILRPQRVAVIGPRGAGKTAVLAMTYVEGLAGRFSDVHLGAADSRTAAFLSDISHDFERGIGPEPTLTPTELRLILMRGDTRVEVVFLEGLSAWGCDAVWLCLPAGGPPYNGDELEAVLSDETPPLAVLLTKADELVKLGPAAARAAIDPLAGHPLEQHFPGRANFVVSSTGTPATFAPSGLEAPLTWLADVLHRQANERLDRLARVAPQELHLVLPTYRSRYPSDELGLHLAARSRKGWHGVAALAALVSLAFLAWWLVRPTPTLMPSPALDAPSPTPDVERARKSRMEVEALEKRDRESLRELEQSPSPINERIRTVEQLIARLQGAPPTNDARNLLARLHRQQNEQDRTLEAERLKRRRKAGQVAYNALRAMYRSRPAESKELRTLAKACIAADPTGPHRERADGVLRYCDALERRGEYAVTIVSGVFDRKATAFRFSLGVRLTVTLEVAGETYGPSAIAKGYFPEWNHEFARKIRWQPGDSIRLLVGDRYLRSRTVADVLLDEPGSIRLLDDSVELPIGTLKFETSFPLPNLPRTD